MTPGLVSMIRVIWQDITVTVEMIYCQEYIFYGRGKKFPGVLNLQVVIKPFMFFTVKQKCLYSKNSFRGKRNDGSFNAERL